VHVNAGNELELVPLDGVEDAEQHRDLDRTGGVEPAVRVIPQRVRCL
jgi:hypothetical protein